MLYRGHPSRRIYYRLWNGRDNTLWTSTSTNLGDSGLTDDGTTVATAENVDTGALAVTGNGTATGTFTTGQGCTGSACISAYGFFDSGAAHEGVLTGQTTFGNWSAAISVRARIERRHAVPNRQQRCLELCFPGHVRNCD